jgi:hypothetical protein
MLRASVSSGRAAVLSSRHARSARNARKGEFVPEDSKLLTSMSSRKQREHRQDLLTSTVRGIVQQEKAAQDAKTAKLRALRLAREADEPPVVEAAPKRSRRKVTTDSGS